MTKELNERRAVIESRFAQYSLQGSVGNTSQGGLTNLLFLFTGVCRCRIDMTVRTVTALVSGHSGHRQSDDLTADIADIRSGRFTNYPIGQYLLQ